MQTNKQKIHSYLLWRWLQLSQRRKEAKINGFTLIELIVVVIIIGILSAVAIPSTLSTIGKGKEAEAKQNLSTMGRGQQTYFFENGQFADSLAKLDMNTTTKYYNLIEPVATAGSVVHRAESINADANNTREYEMGVYFENQGYITILCQSDAPGGLATVPATGTGTTCIEGKKL